MRTKEIGSWTLRSHVLAGHGPTLPRHLGKLLQISCVRQKFGPTYLVVGGLLQAGSRGKLMAGEVVEGQTLEWLKVGRQYVGLYYMGWKDLGMWVEEGEEGIRATGEEVKRRSVDEAKGKTRGKRREWLGRTGARQHGPRKPKHLPLQKSLP